MPIRNKDNSEYKLNSPNPLATQQAKWSDKIILHNLQWESKINLDSEFSSIENDLKKRKEEIKQEIKPIIEEQKLEIKPIIEQKTTETQKPVNTRNIVLMHCLPIVTKVIKDELYGEEKIISKYGEKFIIEGLILEHTDLTFKFWTIIDLEQGTILYPYKHKDGRNMGDFRWWKVNATEKKSEGFIINCIISGFQPNFS